MMSYASFINRGQTNFEGNDRHAESRSKKTSPHTDPDQRDLQQSAIPGDTELEMKNFRCGITAAC